MFYYYWQQKPPVIVLRKIIECLQLQHFSKHVEITCSFLLTLSPLKLIYLRHFAIAICISTSGLPCYTHQVVWVQTLAHSPSMWEVLDNVYLSLAHRAQLLPQSIFFTVLKSTAAYCSAPLPIYTISKYTSKHGAGKTPVVNFFSNMSKLLNYRELRDSHPTMGQLLYCRVYSCLLCEQVFI